RREREDPLGWSRRLVSGKCRRGLLARRPVFVLVAASTIGKSFAPEVVRGAVAATGYRMPLQQALKQSLPYRRRCCRAHVVGVAPKHPPLSHIWRRRSGFSCVCLPLCQRLTRPGPLPSRFPRIAGPPQSATPVRRPPCSCLWQSAFEQRRGRTRPFS